MMNNFSKILVVASIAASAALDQDAYTFIGDFKDGNPRALQKQFPGSDYTPESCYSIAKSQAFKYFGLQYFGECWAGNDLVSATQHGTGTSSTKCTADNTKDCGGPMLNSLYRINAAYYSVGCYKDGAPRALSYQFPGVTWNEKSCYGAATAAGYTVFGLQYGGECWASNDLDAAQIYGEAKGQCTMECRSTPTEICGGSQLNSLFVSSNVSNGPVATPIATPDTPVATVTNLGCWQDNHPRAMTQVSGTGYNEKTCYDAAVAGGYTVFGLQYGGECWVSNDLDAAQIYGKVETNKCDMVCTSAPSEICGGKKLITMFSITSTAPDLPVPTVTNLGCWQDNHPRAMTQISGTGYNEETCYDAAVAGGFTVFGLQYGGECWVSKDLAAAQIYGEVETSKCNMACTSAPTEICGGPKLNTLFSITNGVSVLTKVLQVSASKNLRS